MRRHGFEGGAVERRHALVLEEEDMGGVEGEGCGNQRL